MLPYDDEQRLLSDIDLENGVSPIWRVLQKANLDIDYVEALRKCDHYDPALVRIQWAAMQLRKRCQEILEGQL